MAKRFRVVPIALLGANNAMKNHGDIVTKDELTGSIEDLLAEGFIEEVTETAAEKKAKEKADKDAADAKAKEDAEKAEADKKAKEKEEADKAEADRLAKEKADKDAEDKNPLVEKLKNK